MDMCSSLCVACSAQMSDQVMSGTVAKSFALCGGLNFFQRKHEDGRADEKRRDSEAGMR